MFQNKVIKGNFTHSNNELINKIKVHDTDNGRFYEIDKERIYPSITTILKGAVDFSQWRNAIGDARADIIMRIAAEKGNQLHDLFERYLRNEEISLNSLMPPIRNTFLGAKETLNRINRVDYQEAVLWSDELKVAGRTDVLGQFDSINSVIDFKGSNKPKKKEDITHYFCQATAYHMMAKETLGYNTDQIVILVFPEGEKEPQVFIDKPEKYIEELKRIRQEYVGEFNENR